MRRAFLERVCAQAAFSPAGARLAAAWHDAGMPLETVRQAILLGCLCKSLSLIDWPTAQPMRRLCYFEPLRREVERECFPAADWQHLAFSLHRCEDYWKLKDRLVPRSRQESQSLAATPEHGTSIRSYYSRQS